MPAALPTASASIHPQANPAYRPDPQTTTANHPTGVTVFATHAAAPREARATARHERNPTPAARVSPDAEPVDPRNVDRLARVRVPVWLVAVADAPRWVCGVTRPPSAPAEAHP